jgi:hypothetical protein
MDSGTKINGMTLVGSMILTVAAIIASWPAIVFVLIYYTDHNTGTLVVGGLFSLLAAVLWGSAGWGWSKIRKTD